MNTNSSLRQGYDDDEEDDETLMQSIKDQMGTNVIGSQTASFVGCYVPNNDKKEHFLTTTKLGMISSVPEATMKNQMKYPDRDNFRKKHWLKSYFEEEVKAKVLLKSKSTEGAAGAKKK